MVIFGYDKVSSDFLKLSLENNYHTLIIDIDNKAVEKANQDGGVAIVGDAENIAFLEDNHILRSKIIISTIPYFEVNLNLLHFYKRQINEEVKNKIFISIAYQEKQARLLYREGADYVILAYRFGVKEVVEYIRGSNFNKDNFNKLKGVSILV